MRRNIAHKSDDVIALINNTQQGMATCNKSKEQLRNEIERLIYVNTSSAQFMDFLDANKDKIISFLDQHGMIEKRQHENLYDIDQIRMNNLRYANAFRLSKHLGNVDLLFRKADYLIVVMGITLNTSAFLNTIELLGTPEQAQKWRDLVMTAQATGGYGQTELGHGSNVQGLETQAHYEQNKQAFKIHSPTTTSMKFWPGLLGSSGTHAVIQAKTFVKGKYIGIQTFVIPIRDQNFNVLEGIEAGDIGPKLGFQRVDNGYLKINNTLIPRENMLMKYVQVTPEGQVIGLQNKEAIKYGYGSMLYLRVHLVYGFAFSYMLFPGRLLYQMYEQMGISAQPERRRELIDYLSLGMGTIMSNIFTHKIYNNYLKELNAQNFEKADKLLANCHILSATFKALSSWKGLQVCREIMTKNKYMTFRSTQLPQNFGNSFPSVTYEGDNSVLLQQTARFILMKQAHEEEKAPPETVRDDDLHGALKVLKYVTRMQIKRIKKVFQAEYGNGVDMKVFWNEKHQRDVIEVSKLWGISKFVQGVIIFLDDHKENRETFEKIAKVFTKSMLDDAPKIHLYGFRVEKSESWKSFTESEFWALTNFRRPLDVGTEKHALIPREITMHAKL